MRCTIILVGLMVGTVSAKAVADMVMRADGGIVVGRIAQRTDAGLEINTGTGGEAQPVKLTTAEIKEICTAAQEFERISQSRDVAELKTWAAAYWSARAETPAVLCIRRCLYERPKQSHRPSATADAEFRAFWSRTALNFQAARLALNDAAGWLQLADRARAEGYIEEAAWWIERATAGGKVAETAVARALEWGLPISMTIGVDFGVAMDESVESTSLTDEGRMVTAGDDRVFLHIPVRFDPRRPWTLSRTSIKGRDAKGFYGLRPMRLSKGVPTLGTLEGEPVYERLDTAPESGDTVYRNSVPPRRSSGDANKDRPGRKERRTRSEWVAVVVEIQRGASVANVQLPDDGAEELDLTLIRRVRERAPDWPEGQPKPELLTMISDRVARAGTMPEPGREPRRASIEVGLRALAAMRSELNDRTTPAWNAAALHAVIAAGGSGDPRVRAAAWRCLKSWSSGRAAIIEILAEAPVATRLRWAAQITRESISRRGDGGLSNLLLRGLLRSTETDVCERAIDALQGLGGAADWYALTDGSTTAKALALGRAREMADTDAARACMSALVAGLDERLARPTVESARTIGLRIRDADEPVLQAWGRMTEDSLRGEFLSALSGTDLDAVWHSPAMQRLAMDLRDKASGAVLAGWLPVLEKRVRAAREAGGAAFPMLVARNSGDPLVMGLAVVAARGRIEDRPAAAWGLLDLGYSEEVQRAAGELTDPAWIDRLAEGVQGAPTDAWLGLLARWVGSSQTRIAEAALLHLDRSLAQVDAAELWRAGAAIKTAIPIETLVSLGQSPDPAVFGAALRVLNTIGRMTPQERQRLAADTDKSERLAELRSVDRRRGRLADGRHEVLCVAEMTTRIEMPDGTQFWSEPRRVCRRLPPIHLRLGADDESLTVKWNDIEVGRGRVIEPDRTLKPAAYYYGVLEALDGVEFSAAGAAGFSSFDDGPDSQPVVERPGPLMLPSVAPETGIEPGAVTVEIGAYLRAFAGVEGSPASPGGKEPTSRPASSRTAARPTADIGNQTVEFDSIWAASVPEDYRLTLRYVRFGGWVGVGPRVALPENAEAGDVQFTNIMLIVERTD